jgi:uncharacterized membrane protein YhaH (DUF805 family)
VANIKTNSGLSRVGWLLTRFNGRISRSVYWMATVFLIGVNGVLVGQLLGGEHASFNGLAQTIGPFVILGTLYSNAAIAVKRLHDAGYSGFLAFALFIPLINFAFAIWIGILPGTAGPNAYGDVTDSIPA